MTEQNQTEADKAITAIKQYKQTGDRQKISTDALKAIGATPATRITRTEHDIDPITYTLYKIDRGCWATIVTHSNQQGEKRTRHYLTNIGHPSINVPDPDKNAAQQYIDEHENYDRNAERAAKAVCHEIKALEDWARDGIENGSLWVVGDGESYRAELKLGHWESLQYFDVPDDLNRAERNVLGEARLEAQERAGGRITQYDSNIRPNYYFEIEYDASDIDAENFVEMEA